MKDFFKNKKINKKYNGGFTLIELLVTIVIFVVLTGVVIVNQNSFDNSILLNNFAYDIALTIRQAQSYGVNVQESSLNLPTDSNSFNSPYGVFFDINSVVNRSNFIFYSDTGGDTLGSLPNNKYDGPNMTNCPTDSSECIKKFSIKKGMYISELCIYTSTSLNEICQPVDQLSILFKRPNFKAIIYGYNNGTQIPDASKAEITLTSAGGSTNRVVVTEAGQIYVIK